MARRPRGARVGHEDRGGQSRHGDAEHERPPGHGGHGICHGGFIFALADTNFAYACNSFNHRTVAAGVDINFLAPAHLGDLLTARGQARQQAGRSGVYDIEVTNQANKLIAVFRGRAARIKGHFFDPGENTA